MAEFVKDVLDAIIYNTGFYHCFTLKTFTFSQLMQITLNLDDSLLNEAFQLTNLANQEEVINLALEELVRSRRKKNLLDLAGKIQFAPDFDYKALRETRHAAD
jgi:Arc/MetJ family transcription regulator